MAVALADAMGLPVHLVRVVDFDPVRATVEAGVVAANAYAKAHAADISLAETYLAEQVQILRNKDVATTSELRTGAPASELLDAIRAGDLVVLTTHERGGIQRWFLGSVAEELVRRAAGPVLLVRATAQEPRRERLDDMATTPPTANTPSGLVGAHRDQECCPHWPSGGRADSRGPGALPRQLARSCRPWRNSSICRAASPS